MSEQFWDTEYKTQLVMRILTPINCGQIFLVFKLKVKHVASHTYVC